MEFLFDGDNFLPLGGGNSSIKIGSPLDGGETGCLLYTDKSNLLKQDPMNLYFNDKRKYLSIGHDDPTTNLDVVGPKNQIKISSNSPRECNSSIEFGRYGEDSSFIIGQFGEDFCLKDLKTGEIYQLNKKEKENGTNKMGAGNSASSKRAGK